MIILKLLRVHQWIKNLFIFVPLFFAGEAFNWSQYTALIAGFLSFGFAASAVYIFNDLCDYSVDRVHPEKRLRPIASGKVSFQTGKIILILLAVLSIAISWWLDFQYFLLVLFYLAVNVGYSLGLKNISILDIFLVSSGFIVRIYAGGILGDVPVSHWLAIMVLLLALFLALAKRRDDLVMSADGVKVRKSSQHYNLEFINSCLSIFAGILIVAYILYTLSPDVPEQFNTEWLFSTAVFVIAGIMRYLQITFVDQKSGSPTQVLYKDRFILVTILCWIVSFYIIIYAN